MIFFEILTLFPLFPGDDEIDQVNKIHTIIGSPPQELFDRLIKKFNFLKPNLGASEAEISKKHKKGPRRGLIYTSVRCANSSVVIMFNRSNIDITKGVPQLHHSLYNPPNTSLRQARRVFLCTL